MLIRFITIGLVAAAAIIAGPSTGNAAPSTTPTTWSDSPTPLGTSDFPWGG